MSSKIEIQESFLNGLRQKFKGEPGIDVTLWQLSYSYMKFIVCYTNRDDLLKKILNEEMEGEIFKLLIDFGFKKNFKIE